MTDLKDAILDAKYVEMIGLADFIVRDCALPERDAEGNPVAQQNEIAAAIFRWAAMQRKGTVRPVTAAAAEPATAGAAGDAE